MLGFDRYYANPVYLSRKIACVRMNTVEISTLSPQSAKLKSKNAVFAINSEVKSSEFNGLFFFNSSDVKRAPIQDGVVVLDKPGEFEIGGVKVKGDRFDESTVFSLRIDGMNLLIAPLSVLEKSHGKLQEYDLVLVMVDKSIDPSFVSSLAISGVVYFGEFAKDLSASFLKNENQQLQKFVVTRDKLPQEMITVTLQ